VVIKLDYEFTVITDSSEQKPLLFPPRLLIHLPFVLRDNPYRDSTLVVKLHSEKKSLREWGCDYLIEGHEDLCRIERKFNVNELATNLLTQDRHRQFVSFAKLAKCTRPILLLDMLGSELWNGKNNHSSYSNAHVQDRLLVAAEAFGLEIFLGGARKTTIGTRRKQGGWFARLMVHEILKRERK
jgi:hypothetical protein